MRSLFVTSEVFPLAKTGGLADVSAALPSALSELGIDVRLLMPGYPAALEKAERLREVARLGNVLGFGATRLLETHLPKTQIPVWLIDCPDLYNRAGGGLYQDEQGIEWADNAERFALLSHVAAGIANEAGGRWRPDILHANDWHAGLLPLLIAHQHGTRPATLLTVHNLAYQGLFAADCFEHLALPPGSFERMEFYGRISFIKAGLGSADAISTVSPTYASEILTREHGCGLDGLLREREANIVGILNGADYGLWDPDKDPYIARNYAAPRLGPKRACKQALQRELGLIADTNVPLLAFMSRLAHQKMPDVVLEALPALLDSGIQFALVAEGERVYADAFRDLAARHCGQVAVHIGYEESLAHRLIAGADILLHPSRFEPCGLVPIYAMRYGTIPVVRNSGGTADTVMDATSEAQKSGEATGFSFGAATMPELMGAVRRAVAMYEQPVAWRKLQLNAMRQDFSWRKSAEQYTALYQMLLGKSGSREDAIRSNSCSAEHRMAES